MDPKDNDTQNPSIDDQGQPTPQQKADGELIVSHEVDADLTSTNDMSAADSPLPPTDPSTMTGNTMNTAGNDVLGGGNGMQQPDSFMPPEAPAAPTAPQQPMMSADPTQPPQPMPPQPDPSQQFSPSATPVGGQSMPPVSPDPAVAPLPPANPASPEAASPKKRALVLVTVVMLAVILLGLAGYALMQL